jgi:hypothetical protein
MSFEVTTPGFLIMNDQLLYQLAVACFTTARRQWTGDSTGLPDLMTRYVKSTFSNHPTLMGKFRFSERYSIDWFALSVQLDAYFITEGVYTETGKSSG